jgi:Flp pilus assembly secretin CpaC
MKQKNLIYSALLIAGLTMPLAARAQTATAPAGNDLMPPVSAQSAANPSESIDSETHPSLNLSPDKSELVTLDRDATSVIVGNPNHAGVLLDTPRLAVVIPRTPGATYFTVLDKDGAVIMQRHVIVASPKKNYVRVRRSCGNAAQGRDCQPTSVYFCPDMCHEIGTPSDEAANSMANAPGE